MGMLFFHFFPPPPTPPRGKMAALLADSTPTALASQIFFRARVARVRVYGSMCFDIALRYDIARSDMLNAAAASFSSSMACGCAALRNTTIDIIPTTAPPPRWQLHSKIQRQMGRDYTLQAPTATRVT